MAIEAKTRPVRELFGIDTDMEVPVLSGSSEYIPEIDKSYCFDQETTLAILAGFKYNIRVMIQGYHGTGKSTHIEQVAARLNWPCLRINLDGYLSRSDLIGRDIITIREGKQVTEFQDGMLPWSLKQPMALVFDEYDAARPEVMFVLQRLLEDKGKLTLLEQNQVITPHDQFRIFATSNTVGLGDNTGLYQGTNLINQGHMDRWNIVITLNYLPTEQEAQIVLSRQPAYNNQQGQETINSMIEVARLVRNGFIAGDISCVMSPRTVINWAENNNIFGCIERSFRLTFLNKCDQDEQPIVAEYFQRVFNKELKESITNRQCL